MTDDYRRITVGGTEYRLTLEDDFDGAELNPAIWERCPEQRRQDMGGYWSDACSYLDGNGSLVIEMRDDNGVWRSGAVRSRGKFEQRRGYFETRATLPRTVGYWSAFWLMGDDMSRSNGRGGADGSEVDIYEIIAKEMKLYFTLHWGGYGKGHRSVGGNIGIGDDFFDKPHTFGLEWLRDRYVWYVDGAEVCRVSGADCGGTCERPLFLKLSSEVGTWGGGLDPADTPSLTLYDYVRVYEAVE